MKNIVAEIVEVLKSSKDTIELEQRVHKKLGEFRALLASLWVRNAAVPCNQATLGTFDFRLGSGMRISEHTRYTISIMF